MANLPKSGVSLVVENAAKAIRDVANFSKALDQQGKAAKSYAQIGELSQQGFQKTLGRTNNYLSTLTKGSSAASSAVSKTTSAIMKSLSGVASNFLSNIPVLGQFSGAITGAMGSMSAFGVTMTAALPVIGAVVLAVGAAAAAFGVFFALGSRGARLQPTIDAFGNLASQYGDSTEILNKLREQTKGTISDMELMRIATFALSGASQELGQVFANDLGKNLNDVGRLAVAMGRDPVEAQTRWIDALKKGERELLDELGIIVSATEANKKYAESVGKSAESLTAYEKTAAFAKEASLQLNDAVSKLPEQSGVLVTLQRFPVLLRNLLDKVSLAIQPVFEPFVEGLNIVINGIEYLSSYGIPLMSSMFKVIGAVISEVQQTAKALISDLFGGFAEGASTVLPYVVAAFQLAAEGIIAVIRAIGTGIRFAITGFFIVFRSIGKAIGGFFGGVGDTVDLNINQLVFNMAKGGAFVVGSFAAGLLRGGTYVLQAVTQIAQIVADFLMGFSPPKKGVLHNIDRGGENVAISWVDGFVSGVTGSFDKVTEFVNGRLGAIANFSRETIEARLSQLDLAIRPFKESLQIIKADMEAIAGFTDPALKILERQRTNLLKAFGKGQGGLDIEQLRTQDRQIQRLKELKDLSQDRIDQAELQLSLAESQQAQERALLDIAKNRLGKEQEIAGAVEKTSKEAGGGAGKEPKGSGSGAGGSESKEPGGMDFGGGSPDVLSNEAVEAAKAKIIGAIGGLVASASSGLQEGLSASGLSNAAGGFNAQRGALNEQMGRIQEADPAQKIADKFATLKEKLAAPLEEVKALFNEQFDAMFGEEGTITGFITGFGEKMLLVFTGDDSPVTLAKNAVGLALLNMAENFLWLKDQISEKLALVGEYLSSVFINEDSVIGKVWENVKYILDAILGENGFMRLVNDGEGTLRGALSTLGQALRDVMINPMITAAEAVGNAVVEGLNNVIKQFNSLPIPVEIGLLQHIRIQIPGMAKGTLDAINSPFMAGERGRELIVPSKNNPLSVFPNKATLALERISRMTMFPSAPAPMPYYANPPSNNNFSESSTNYTNSNNRNVVNNFRHKPTRLEMAQLRADM